VELSDYQVTTDHAVSLSAVLQLFTSIHSRPVFITILFLQPCQDWIIHRRLRR